MTQQDIFRKIKRIEIKTRKLVESYFSGQYGSIFKGRGMNFSDVREYQPGDDIRSIDWNVTARLGKPFIKQFTEERELTIIVAVDLSASENFGSREQTKKEIACEIASILAFSALKNQDNVGLVLFTEGAEKYLPPKKHRQYVLRIIREILYYRPKFKGTSIEKTLSFINDVTRKKAVIFMISDFIDGNYEKIMAITNRKHDLIAVSINDGRERELPDAGLIEVEDSENGERMFLNSGNSRMRERYREEMEKITLQRKRFFAKSKIDHIEITADRPYIESLQMFFRLREGRRR